ncbi:Radical SAM domain protein, pyruvate formate-lyase activating enzyme -like protein [Thermoplasmatales archaeon BRNA1]|nr:Radical SAM domain protein, pyruvate formate-lyase activating enzyme -like protein [Thermoplasmatales archaeon BRNA1]
MAFVRFDSGSAANGPLAKGCELCIKGSKMVLLVTGRCRAGCFYCPVSAEKKGKDVVYANEGRVDSDGEILEECRAMAAEGAGITGGDPSETLDRTLHYISLLKDAFGKDFHLHMYTSVISLENAKKLEAAGLDEIRYHPRDSTWADMEGSELPDIVSGTSMDVGIEIPALPGREDDIIALAKYAFGAGIRFMNLNELEFSESNWGMMESRGYEMKDDVSAAVLGAEETAIAVMDALPDLPIHFCSSTFKDGVQLRNRLKRRAENTAREYDVVTDDGTFLKGIVYADDLEKAASYMREQYEVPDELMFIDRDRNRMEIAAWILEEIGRELPFRCYIVEEYPTRDRLEVERTPVN